MDTTTCYWCEKNCMSCNLMLCQSCRKVSYCGKKCQIRDWKSFHKDECKQIKSGQKSTGDVGMSNTRLDTLSKHGVQRATLPIPIAPPDDTTSVWRRDLLLLYLIHADVDADGLTCSLGATSKGFPRGLAFCTREVQDFRQARLSSGSGRS